MKIIVHGSDAGNCSSFHHWMNECLAELAAQTPKDEFILIFKKSSKQTLSFPKNVRVHFITPAINNLLTWRLWYYYKLPAFAKKSKADIIFHANGFCSLRTKIPQCVLIPDLSFRDTPELWNTLELSALKRFSTEFIRKAKYILTFSEYSKKEIEKITPQASSKINILHIGIPVIYQPLNWEEKEVIKKKYSTGKEYFLFTGTLRQAKFLTLLKAFSIFKKKLKSNLQLVIADTSVHRNHQAEQDLKTYKYRDSIILLHHLSETDAAALTASAYSLIQPLQNESSLVTILKAVQCQVPAIVAEANYFREKLNTAALYFTPEQFEELAEKMIAIYIEEEKRKTFIEKEKELSGHLQIEKTIGGFREAILQAAKQ